MISGREQRHFIIGGTIKAATSSLFNYLGAHPEVCASRIKETFFFSRDYSGNDARDYAEYLAYFTPEAGHRILLEASPNYLAYKENVAPRIKQLLPNVKLLFVLRNPVDRLYSHYNFARSKLELPQDLRFDDFVDLCEGFNRGEVTPAQAGIAEKHLRALEIGNYGRYLQNYYDIFDAGSIKVIFFDDLNRDPVTQLVEISEFIGVEPDFFQNFIMNRANVTFFARQKHLHSIALFVNRILEPFFRRHPLLKHRLMKFYKFFNRSTQTFAPMSESVREKLNRYYKPNNDRLKIFLPERKMPSWLE